MSRRLLVTDAAIAALVAVLVLVLTPGLAIAGVLALIVLLVCGISLLIGRVRRRSIHERALRRFPR